MRWTAWIAGRGWRCTQCQKKWAVVHIRDKKPVCPRCEFQTKPKHIDSA